MYAVQSTAMFLRSLIMRGDEAVHALPEPYRRALGLAIAGSSDEEVARLMGLSEASMPVLLQIAIAKLSRALSQPRVTRQAGSPETGGS